MMRGILSGNFLRLARVAAVLGLLAASCHAQATPPPGVSLSSASPHGSFLVFPFENAGAGNKLDWLSEGLEELSIQRLATAGEQVYAREARIAELERYGLPGHAKFSRATMLHLAEELDADFVVFGSYTFDGNILTVEARLVRTSPPALLPAVRETGLLETLMDLHTRVIWRLLSGYDKNYPVSLAQFARAQKPLRLDAFEHYVRGLLTVEEEPRARELGEAVHLEPDWPDPAFALGQIAFTKRDCPMAVTWFSRVPASHERYAEAMFSIGVCRLWTNEPERAEATFASLQTAMRRSGSDTGDLPEVLNNLAIARARSGKLPLAQQDLARAADLDPDESDYAFNLGWVALRANDDAGAAAQFREALQREPDDTEARALLIYSLEHAGMKAEADEERAAAASARNAGTLPVIRPESLAERGRIISGLDVATLPQEIQFAGGHAEGAAAAAPVAAPTEHVRRGRQELATGHVADAEREFRVALAADPRDAAAHRGLADVLRRQGKLDDAVQELRAAIEARDSASARTALARIYLEQKKPEVARAELERALQLAPNYAQAKQLLQRLEAPKPGGTTP